MPTRWLNEDFRESALSMNVDSPDIMSASSDAITETVDAEEQAVTEVEETTEEQPETEVEAEESAEESSTSEPTGEDSPAEPKKKNRTQERIDELTAKRREAEREAEYWKSKAQPAAEADSSIEPVRPTLESLDYDNDRYEQAMDEYAAKKAKHEIYKAEEAQRQSNAQLEQQRTRWAFEERANKFARENPDFNQVINNPDLRITEHMASAITLSEKGPEIGYYLAKNPQLASEIASLSQAQQFMQLGRIEAELSTRVPTVTPSKAPPPARPIGSKSVVDKSPESMSYDEYKAWRMKQK